MIETVVQLKPRSEWREGVKPESLRAELEQRVKLPGVSNAWVMPIRTRIDMLSTGIKTPVGIQVTGPDLKRIDGIGRELEQLLPVVSGTLSVYAERVVGGRYIRVDIDRARAARFGLNIRDIQAVATSAIGGMNVTSTVEGLARYPVNLRYPQSFRDSVEALEILPVVTPSGQGIALGDVADIVIEDGPGMIRSENARPAGRVLVDIEDVTWVPGFRKHRRWCGSSCRCRPGMRWSGLASMNTWNGLMNDLASLFRPPCFLSR